MPDYMAGKMSIRYNPLAGPTKTTSRVIFSIRDLLNEAGKGWGKDGTRWREYMTPEGSMSLRPHPGGHKLSGGVVSMAANRFKGLPQGDEPQDWVVVVRLNRKTCVISFKAPWDERPDTAEVSSPKSLR